MSTSSKSVKEDLEKLLLKINNIDFDNSSYEKCKEDLEMTKKERNELRLKMYIMERDNIKIIHITPSMVAKELIIAKYVHNEFSLNEAYDYYITQVVRPLSRGVFYESITHTGLVFENGRFVRRRILTNS